MISIISPTTENDYGVTSVDQNHLLTFAKDEQPSKCINEQQMNIYLSTTTSKDTMKTPTQCSSTFSSAIQTAFVSPLPPPTQLSTVQKGLNSLPNANAISSQMPSIENIHHQSVDKSQEIQTQPKEQHLQSNSSINMSTRNAFAQSQMRPKSMDITKYFQVFIIMY